MVLSRQEEPCESHVTSLNVSNGELSSDELEAPCSHFYSFP